MRRRLLLLRGIAELNRAVGIAAAAPLERLQSRRLELPRLDLNGCRGCGGGVGCWVYVRL